MGMHYYVKNNEMEIRVGKSSIGWQFLFYGYKDLGLNSKEDWFKFLKNNKDFIFTEDDVNISYEELSSLINFKSYSNKEFKNHYEEVSKEGMLDESRTILDKEGYTFLYNNFDIVYNNKIMDLN